MNFNSFVLLPAKPFDNFFKGKANVQQALGHPEQELLFVFRKAIFISSDAYLQLFLLF